MKTLVNTPSPLLHSQTEAGWRKPLRQLNPYLLLSILSPVLFGLAWYLTAHYQLFPAQILVPPENVWRAFVGLVQSGELKLHLGDSLYRLFVGFSVGALGGIVFGILYAALAWFREYFCVLFNVLYQIPIFVLIPIFILIFGIGEVFKILLIIKACFFPIALASMDAVKNIPKQYIELGKVYQLKTKSWLKFIILPSILPPLISGLRIALGRAWLILVAVELLAAGTGIGQMMELGRQMLRLDVVMVGVFITGIVGFMLDKGLRVVEQRYSSHQVQAKG